MSDHGLKLVLAGPLGAGKTTALRALSDTEPVSTEVPLSDGPIGNKTTTTVALDFAVVLLEEGTPLQIYGLPGQDHLAHMRSIVLEGAFGVILLLPGDDPDIARQCGQWRQAITEVDPTMPMVVGITRTDRAPRFRMTAVREALADAPAPVPVFTVDARDSEQVAQLVRTLLLLIEA